VLGRPCVPCVNDRNGDAGLLRFTVRSAPRRPPSCRPVSSSPVGSSGEQDAGIVASATPMATLAAGRRNSSGHRPVTAVSRRQAGRRGSPRHDLCGPPRESSPSGIGKLEWSPAACHLAEQVPAGLLPEDPTVDPGGKPSRSLAKKKTNREAGRVPATIRPSSCRQAGDRPRIWRDSVGLCRCRGPDQGGQLAGCSTRSRPCSACQSRRPRVEKNPPRSRSHMTIADPPRRLVLSSAVWLSGCDSGRPNTGHVHLLPPGRRAVGQGFPPPRKTPSDRERNVTGEQAPPGHRHGKGGSGHSATARWFPLSR